MARMYDGAAMKLKATIVPDIRSDLGHQPGAVEIRELYGEVKGLACRCPCGCGEEIWLPVRPMGSPEKGNHPRWGYDGNAEAPTLSPSVYNTGLPCKWHGFLRNGEWTEA